ncbi:MFS transporter [Tersicoccus solisilvae]|uniref:MFS transporter n=1 Tax=Tersicoccus solisilvae TaxID=1882339 RepID=A0ABQ1PLY4_9MICC|nr:MFS transporter [Tersicoccus solisilvae]GGC99551.1 MFS transporter [Tersicoccus solisilvae]
MSTSLPGSSHPAATGDVDAPTVPRRRIILASLVGTSIEFYDFYVYATAAISVFPLLFFPKGNEGAAVLASLATFGVAFVARPIGSILFGHFGDRVGRKATLLGSLLTMGIATFLIGLLPTYQQIGVFAPALLAIMRFAQGLGLGGEWSGAALLATETAAKGKRAWAAMWPQLGAPIGFFFANGLFLVLTLLFGHDSTKPLFDGPFLTWGWRLPFLLSIIIVAIGLYVRIKLEETPVFARAVARGEKVKAPLGVVFRRNWVQVVQGTFIMLATYGVFYLMTTWILSYAIGSTAQGKLGIGYRDFLVLQLVAILFFAAFVPISGWLADRYGRRPTLLVITGLIIVFGFTFTLFLSRDVMGTGASANMGLMLLFLCIGMALMGLTFGPMSAVLPELFPTNTRYTGSGIAYNVASILGAAITPFVADALVQSVGVGWVGIYLAFMGALTFIALWFTRETRHRNLDTLEDEAATVAVETTSP